MVSRGCEQLCIYACLVFLHFPVVGEVVKDYEASLDLFEFLLFLPFQAVLLLVDDPPDRGFVELVIDELDGRWVIGLPLP